MFIGQCVLDQAKYRMNDFHNNNHMLSASSHKLDIADQRIDQYYGFSGDPGDHSTMIVGGIVNNFHPSERFGSSYLSEMGSLSATSRDHLSKSNPPVTRGPGVSLYEMPLEKLQSGYPMFQ